MSAMSTREQMQSRYYLQTHSPVYQQVLRNCEAVAKSNANVLILGDSGTGKDVAAQYIHACSQRAAMPFVAVNCNAYTDTLLESELFGHEQGAFTGAARARVGRFEQADKGTLFIDEVGDIPLTTQIKLLRAIETKVIERLGGSEPRHSNFRLICATNKDPYAEVTAGSLREDFIYRISTIVIRVPSLRERRDDLNDLITFFLNAAQKEHGIEIRAVEPEVRTFLLDYDYPGNIRELRNIIDRMVVLSEDGVITKSGLPILYDLKKVAAGKAATDGGYRMQPWRDFKRKSESDYLAWVLEQTGGNVSEAARLLGLSARQIFNKISEYDLR